MKKIIIILFCIGLIGGMSGCQQKEIEEPKVVLDSFLKAFQSLDEQKIKETSSKSDFNVKALQIQKSDYIEGVDKQLQKQVYDMMRKFDYKIGKQSINDKRANVEILFTLYDFEPVIEEGFIKATQRAQELSQDSNITDASVKSAIQTVLLEHMRSANKSLKKEIKMLLIMENDRWIVSNDNKEFQDMIIENIRSLESINNS